MTGQELIAPGAGAPGADTRVKVLGAVRWVFSDPDWSKSVLLGVVFLLIPVAGPIALAGWKCEIHQRLVRGHPRPMPKLDFNDFGHYLSRGVTPFLVQLAVTLPVLLVTYGLVVAGGISVVVAERTGGADVALLVLGLVFALVGLCAFLVLSVVVNAAETRAELTENIGQALSFSQLMQYSRATWTTVMWKYIVFGFVATGLFLCGLVLCYFGAYPAMIVVQLAAVALRFQIYRGYLADGGEMIALKAPVALPSEAPPAPPGYPGY
jgi:hypothetical protein